MARIAGREPVRGGVAGVGLGSPVGAEALRRHAGDHGPLSLLLKPIDYAELAAALRRAAAAGAAEAVPRLALAS